jgi:nicotinate-nucleotide adenylyltransferase
MKIGILGGTFDPVHTGHLVLAQECWHKLALNKVFFVPSNVSPFKPRGSAVSPADRLNMLRLALEGDARFGISTCEIDREGPSYTIDTVRTFRRDHGDKAELFFLAGSDSAEGLPMWKNIDEILDVVTFVIATRPPWSGRSEYGERVAHVAIPSVDVSSTIIRDRIREREPIDYLVPREVVEYIRNKGLYRD